MRRPTFLVGALGAFAALGNVRPATAQTLTPIIVGAGLIEPHAEGFYALETGIFRKHGLDAQIRTMSNGAAIAAALVGGDLQFGVSNVLQLAQAHGRGIPLKVVALGGLQDARFPHSGLVVPVGTATTSPKDLSGHVIGVATLQGLDQLGAVTMIDKSGGNSASVQFVEVTASEAVAAVVQGRIAAATLEDPQLTAGLATKQVRSLGDINDAIAPHFITTAWVVNTNWLTAADANRDTARRFAAAIYEAGAWAMANPVAAAGVLAKHTHTTEARAADRFATGPDPAAMQVLLDVVARYKFAPPTTADLMWNGA